MNEAAQVGSSAPFGRRSCVVTGGGRGIGAGVALRLAHEGAQVAVWDLDGEAARQTAQRIVAGGGQAVGIACDVSDADAVAAAMETTTGRFGVPTLAVTAAGIIKVAPFLELRASDFASELSVNLLGTFLTVQACAKAMTAEAARGAIVCVASVAGRGPRADSAGYAASKAGVISVVRSAAVALASRQIRVNAVCPGVVDTAMTQSIAAARAAAQNITVADALQPLIDRIPLGRMQTPDDVADVVTFLLSDAASYVTGQALNACGGLEFD